MKPIYFQDFVGQRGEAPRGLDPGLHRQGRLGGRQAQRRPLRGRQAGGAGQGRRRSHAERRQPAPGFGRAAERIVELHGNASYAKCLECGERHELAELKDSFLKVGEIPYCRRCGGLVKTATISFGQPMPAGADGAGGGRGAGLRPLPGARLIVGGLSGGGFPLLAKQNGARLAIVNREPTDLDGYADLVLHDEIGPALSAAVAAN
jgi:NAD-dependent deacetylase